MTEDKPKEELKAKVEELAEDKQKVEPIKVDDSLALVQDKLIATKKLNDDLEAEQLRSEELRAKQMLGGRAQAGQPEENQDDKDKKEAAEHLSKFQ